MKISEIEAASTLGLALLKMRHARAVVEIQKYIAIGNQELAERGGWRCDWSIPMGHAIEECLEIEKRLEEAIERMKK